MMFMIYAGHRKNSVGKIEISLRFRCGRVDQQACCNIWVRREMLCEERYVSAKGKVAHRLVWREPGPQASGELSMDYAAAKDALQRLMAYIEECFCMVRRHEVEAGWLAETIERFHADEKPRIEEERTEVLALIDAFMAASGMEESSTSRIEAYSLVRRSVARFEAFRKIKYPRFRLMAGRLDDAALKAFERFMRKEHVWVRKYPQIATGRGLEGRTRAKSQNTVNDRMKLLKAILSWAVRTRRIPRNPFDTFVRGQNVYGSPVYLTLEERRKIELCDLSANERLAVQRDIFIFQCCVGCRVSDLMNLTRSNIVDGELNYVARKTREGRPVTIKVPLNRTAMRIIGRYADPERESLFRVNVKTRLLKYGKR